VIVVPVIHPTADSSVGRSVDATSIRPPLVAVRYTHAAKAEAGYHRSTVMPHSSSTAPSGNQSSPTDEIFRLFDWAMHIHSARPKRDHLQFPELVVGLDALRVLHFKTRRPESNPRSLRPASGGSDHGRPWFPRWFVASCRRVRDDSRALPGPRC